MKIVSDIFGLIGVLLTIVLYQQKSRKQLIGYKLAVDLVWLLHYCFISAFSGAVVCIIAAVRELVFVKRDPKKASGIVWLPVFVAIAIISTLLTWDNWFSLLTCIASCIAVVSFFIGIPSLSRILVFPISGCMLVYDVAVLSVAGIVNECIAMTSSLIGIIRLDRKRGKDIVENPQEE